MATETLSILIFGSGMSVRDPVPVSHGLQDKSYAYTNKTDTTLMECITKSSVVSEATAIS